MKIYIGNLSFSTTEEKLSETFSAFGSVSSVRIMKDKYTEQSKGFGFIEMEDDAAALDAISKLHGKDLEGRKIRVSQAVEKGPRRPRN